MFLFLYSVAACVHDCQECVVRDNINNYLKRCDVYHISRNLHQEAFLVVIIHSKFKEINGTLKEVLFNTNVTYIHTNLYIHGSYLCHSLGGLLTYSFHHLHTSLLS